MATLTAATLAAHDSALGHEAHGPLFDEGADLRALAEAEASIARREHVSALLREYEQLQALAPSEARGWQKRREHAAACCLQTAWRRRASLRGMLRSIEQLQIQRRVKAATTIQRVQRTRFRVVAEAAPSISAQQVANIQSSVVARTLQMAREMRAARNARNKWRDEPHDEQGLEPPPLPTWATMPAWVHELDTARVRGSALACSLRDAARWGLSAGNSPQSVCQAIQDWPQLRAAMQADAVRQQVGRTQAAALHAQLRRPPALPSAARIRSDMAAEAAVPPVLPSKPSGAQHMPHLIVKSLVRMPDNNLHFSSHPVHFPHSSCCAPARAT